MSTYARAAAHAVRLFAGTPSRVYAEAVDGGAEVEMRCSATMLHPGGVTSQFDVGFELPRRDELELIGTGGKIVVGDPWLCRRSTIEVHRDGRVEHLPVDPANRFSLRHDDLDVYRIELDAVSETIAAGDTPAFGGSDALDQAHVLDRLMESSRRHEAVVI